MLIDHASAELAPADTDTLTLELTRTLAVGMGTMMRVEDRSTWQIAMVQELQDIPADLVVEALGHVRRTCSRVADVLPAIIAYVEDYPARRRARLRQLITLADVAGVPVE